MALVLLAFALRLAFLDRRPLHFDEGNSIYFAWIGWDRLLADVLRTGETDPMIHRLTMGLWMRMAGITPFAVRSYSAFYAVLTVALFARVLRLLRAGSSVTVVGCLLLAMSAFAIDYAQQAKGYAMGACLVLLSWWMWIAWTRTARSRVVMAVYVMSLAAALGTHYYIVPILGMHWLWWMATVWKWGRVSLPGLRGDVIRRLLVQGLALAPNALWAAVSLPAVVGGSLGLSSRSPLNPVDLLRLVLGEWSAGTSAPEWAQTFGAIVFAGLIILGLVRVQRDAKLCGLVWFGASLVIPITFAFLTQLRVTFFYPRFLLYALPCVLALVAVALAPARGAQARPIAPRAAIAACALLLLACIAGFYTSPIDSANDYRPMLAALRHWIRPGDIVLGTYIWMPAMMDSYAPELAGSYAWREDFANPDNANALLPAATVGSDRVWSLNYLRDPDASDTGAVMWLRRELAYVDRVSIGTLSVLLFSRNPSLSGQETFLTATFGDRIRIAAPHARGSLSQGQIVETDLQITALTPLERFYAISLQLVDVQNALIAQNDGDAVNGLLPSIQWRSGDVITDRRALLIREKLPSGTYRLLVALYDRATGERLRTADGAQDFTLGQFTVD